MLGDLNGLPASMQQQAMLNATHMMQEQRHQIEQLTRANRLLVEQNAELTQRNSVATQALQALQDYLAELELTGYYPDPSAAAGIQMGMQALEAIQGAPPARRIVNMFDIIDGDGVPMQPLQPAEEEPDRHAPHPAPRENLRGHVQALQRERRMHGEPLSSDAVQRVQAQLRRENESAIGR